MQEASSAQVRGIAQNFGRSLFSNDRAAHAWFNVVTADYQDFAGT